MQNVHLLSTNPHDANVVVYFTFVGTGMSPAYIFDMVHVAKDALCVVQRVFPDADLSVAGYHTHESTHRTLDALGLGVGMDTTWELEFECGIAPALSIYSADKSMLFRLAEEFSKNGATCTISRWARIRRRYVDGVVVMDAVEVPYTNVSADDWV